MTSEPDREGVREQLLQLLDGELDEPAARELNERLRADDELRSELAMLVLQRSHLAQISRELDAAFERDDEDVVETAAQPAPEFGRAWHVAIFAAAMGAAAAVVLAVSLTLGALKRPAPVVTPPAPGPAPEAPVEVSGDDLWAYTEEEAGEEPATNADDASARDERRVELRAESPGPTRVSSAPARPEPADDHAEAKESLEPFDPHAPSHADFGRGGYVAYIETVQGDVEFARLGSDEWRRARPGISLARDDRVKTGMGRARVNFYSESTLELNRFTQVRFASGASPWGISVASGEVFVLTAKLDSGFFIDTPHGRATDLGTEFGVGVGPITGTTVLVAKGAVEASTELGTASVGDRSEVTLASRKSAPGQVRKLSRGELARKLAWTKDIPGGREHRYAQPSLASGLVGYWRFNEGRGAVAYDTSPSALHGKVVGASRVGGYVGGSLLFDGKADFVRVDLDTDTKFARGVTIAGWVRLDSRDARAQTIAGLHGLSLTVSGGRIDCEVVRRDKKAVALSAAAGSDAPRRLATGHWYHVAVVLVAEDGTLATYVNGAADLRARVDAARGLKERALHIGQHPSGKAGRFDGRIDELCLYSRPLTDDEIRMLAAWPSTR